MRREIAWVAGDHRLSCPSRANDVSIRDIVGRRPCQQQTDGGRVRGVEGTDMCSGLADQPGQANLPGRAANRPRQSSGRDCDAQPTLCGAGDECDHAAVVTIQRDQPARIERYAVQAAFPFREVRPCTRERRVSAHARSFFVNGPPVCRRASLSISRHPAASKRAMSTACLTKAEMLGACPAATSSRTWSS